MNIKLEEYVRGSRIRLSVDDAPMTALRSLVSAFVTARDTVEEHYEPVEYDMSRTEKQREINRQRSAFVEEMVKANRVNAEENEEAERGCGHDHTPNAETIAAMEEVTQKRKRRTKAEMLAAAQQEAPPLESQTTSGDTPAPETAVTESLAETETATSAEAANTEEPTFPFDAASAEAESTETASPALSDASSLVDTAEVTDTELQRFCGRLAQHFGGAQKVFDLSKDFVPADAVARPTNIKDNAQRWAFIRHAEEASEVKYHG